MRGLKYAGSVAFLGLLVLAGAVAGVRQLAIGLGATALREPVVWGLYVVCFAYFAGLGAGALTVASAAICCKREEHRSLARTASVVSLVSLMLAGMFITIDLGRPDRAIYLMLKGRLQSPIVWDMVILNCMLLLAAVYVFVALRIEVLAGGKTPEGRIARLLAVWHKPGQDARVPRVIRRIAGVAVVAVPVLYVLTARVFATLRARPDWNTTALAPIFLVSALLSGLAAVIVATGLAGGLKERGEPKAAVGQLLTDGLILLIAVDLVLSLSPLASMRQFASPSQHETWGHIGGAAAIEIVLGLIAPLVILIATRGKPGPWPRIAGVLVLLGVFVKRWHIIVPAMLRRNLPLPEAAYHPNAVEIAVALGIAALGLLLVHVLVRWRPRASRRPDMAQ